MRVRIASLVEYRPDPRWNLAVPATACAIAARTGGAVEKGDRPRPRRPAPTLTCWPPTCGPRWARRARKRGAPRGPAPYRLDEEKAWAGWPGCVVLHRSPADRGAEEITAALPTGRAASSGTRRRTGCTRRRRCWPGCWSDPDDPREPAHQDRAAGPDRRHPDPDRGPVPGRAVPAAHRAGSASPRPPCPATWTSWARCGCAGRTGRWLRAAGRAGRPRLTAWRAARGRSTLIGSRGAHRGRRGRPGGRPGRGPGR